MVCESRGEWDLPGGGRERVGGIGLGEGKMMDDIEGEEGKEREEGRDSDPDLNSHNLYLARPISANSPSTSTTPPCIFIFSFSPGTEVYQFLADIFARIEL